MTRPLNRAQIAAIKKDGCHRVDRQLYIQIRGSWKSWLFRFQRNGESHWLSLGSVELVTLADAKKKTLEYRAMLAKGESPLDTLPKKQKAKEKRAQPTFAECAERYIADHKAAWRSEKTVDRWKGIIANYAVPAFGKKPVDAITVKDVLALLKTVWTSKCEVARKLRSYIERVLDWARAMGYRDANTPNPAAWDGSLSHLLPPLGQVRVTKKYKALAYSETPSFAKKLIDNGTISARALLFCMLTASRTAMVTGATWREVEGDALRIPARRMKNGEEFLIPLVPAATKLMGEPGKPDEYLFPGARKGKPLSQQALLEMMRGIVGRGEAVPHGLRSTFRTWAGEKTNVAREVIEQAMAHAVGSQVERAYMRGTLFEKRRELMQKWCNYCVGVDRVQVVWGYRAAAGKERLSRRRMA